ncbi:hypothetical protein RFI_23729 [Reticulomyxa filosa]|uniref:Uncharacterized protein n=1 Tax=Reticulomyxa filosa TaxID=46433 RepID=X6MKN0_RETFI|nr:hypothetical protein RFI_23729 [Reticulomyxa filosa]|eukprot:ETO13640.1 hypothetical protein RFI_23729 [Reticulomyxa filosa]
MFFFENHLEKFKTLILGNYITKKKFTQILSLLTTNEDNSCLKRFEGVGRDSGQSKFKAKKNLMYDDLNVSGTGMRGQVDKEQAQAKPFESKINHDKDRKFDEANPNIGFEEQFVWRAFVGDFQKFKKQLFGWHQFVAMDMENAWSLVEDITEDQAHKLDVKGKVSVQAENVGEKLISYIRLNIALHTNNSMRLNKAYESIATFKNLNLLDDDETMLAFCATPFFFFFFF